MRQRSQLLRVFEKIKSRFQAADVLLAGQCDCFETRARNPLQTYLVPTLTRFTTGLKFW